MSTIIDGDFEWDSAKARANLTKHRVSFEEATTVFDDPRALDAPDLYEADRFVIIGRSSLSRVLFVVHAVRGGRSMKKGSSAAETSMTRYDWTKSRRGHWAGRLRTSRAVLLPADVYAFFGSDQAVNAALAAIAKRGGGARTKRRRRAA